MKGRYSTKVLLCIFLSLLATPWACAKLSGDIGAKNRPRDFSIEYHWNSGMQPSPRHFEYTVTINPAGEGKVVMIPDYPAYTDLSWTESFSIQGKDLDTLYEVMVENGLFTRKWKRLEPGPPGCYAQSIIVTAGGKRIIIEDCLPSDEEALAKQMSSAITETAPRAIWDKLNSQREEYVQKHSLE